jgi:DNA-directed RNA polymerase subunit RPC12/RpoP
MTNDHVSVSFSCKKCGTKLSWPDDAEDALQIACSGCGAPAGTYGDLKKTAIDAAKEKIEDMFKNAFRKR